MLSALLAELYPDDEERWLHVQAATWSETDLRLDSVVRGDESEQTSWRIACSTVVHFSLTEECHDAGRRHPNAGLIWKPLQSGGAEGSRTLGL